MTAHNSSRAPSSVASTPKRVSPRTTDENKENNPIPNSQNESTGLLRSSSPNPTNTFNNHQFTSAANAMPESVAQDPPSRRIKLFFVERERIDDIKHEFEFPSVEEILTHPHTKHLLKRHDCTWLIPNFEEILPKGPIEHKKLKEGEIPEVKSDEEIKKEENKKLSKTAEDIMVECTKHCRIIPSQIKFFGLYSNIHGCFLPPLYAFDVNEDINCEFRIRFMFSCDADGHAAQRLCLVENPMPEDYSKSFLHSLEVMYNRESLLYYFHQLRHHFLTDQLESTCNGTDANLSDAMGIAILDLFRMSCTDTHSRTPYQLLHQKVIKLRHLLPASVYQKVSSKNMINSRRIKTQFAKTATHHQHKLKEEVDDNNMQSVFRNTDPSHWTDYSGEYRVVFLKCVIIFLVFHIY